MMIQRARDRMQGLRRQEVQTADDMSGTPQEITGRLNAWRLGDSQALDAVMPVIYTELRRLASVYMQGERPGHLLQTTALVHEAWIKLVQRDGSRRSCALSRRR